MDLTNNILIPALAMSTFAIAIGFLVWQYSRVKESQEKRDER